MKNINTWKIAACTSAFVLSAFTLNAAELEVKSYSDYGNSHANFPPSKAFDGSSAWKSRWAADNSALTSGNSNLIADLGSAQTVTEVGISWGRGTARSYRFEIRTRPNTSSSSWTKVYSGWSAGDTNDIEVYDVSDISAQQIRVKVFENDAGKDWTDITEVKIYGDSNSSAELDPNLPPSGNFDLSQWKITLPTSKDAYFGSGGTAAAEIQPEDCSNSLYTGPGIDEGFEDNDYFHTGSEGSMIFSTPLTGGAVTTNTSYVRSELRELYNWSPCGDDGAANWSPSGKHVLTGTLRVTDYEASDPQTVVGQIHAKESSYALVKLQWDGPSKDIRAIINESASDGGSFSLDFDLIPGTDEWSYVIELEDDTVTISVTVGSQTETRSVKFGEGDMSDDWLDHVYYFKAGNYAQADKDSGGNFEVRFTALNVSHSN